MERRDWTKLILISFAATGLPFLVLSLSPFTQKSLAYSAGPPAGYTGAPGEFTCAECHVPESQGSGQTTLTVPANYVPGQTYQIAVHHINNDPSRVRWGFQLTALDDGDAKAGELQSTDSLTQVLNNQGPGGGKQYIEHTSLGTFYGQTGGADWTFNWTAPSADVGRVTFYVAGNQANGDGNTSGDFIHFTFAESFPVNDFTIAATPATQTVLQSSSANYDVSVVPSGGFNGPVSLSVSGVPSGATANFNPASVNITDASPKTSTLTISANGATPLGLNNLTIAGMNGSTQHTYPVKLKISNSSSADLGVTQTISPNPALVGTSLSHRIVVTNSGPATASNVTVTDNLAAGFSFGSATASQGSCNATANVSCALGSLASGASAVITIVATPTMTGSFSNTATATATENDPDNSDNSATVNFSAAQSATTPTMLDPHLSVQTVVTQLSQPTSLAFIANNDFFVLEKDTGKVQRVVNGVIQSTVLDLPVNSASERGALGIALHPDFLLNKFVYLYWTESSTGFDSTNLADVATLGNRVDRYIWNGSTLVFDRNLIRLRAYQADSNQTLRGNHNGGVLRFGPDGKLYIMMGDNGRRGLLQNNQVGPVPDDQFGGPEPDNNHLTGFILRLNDDGSTPADNPFFSVSTSLTGEAAANIKKLFAYGVRNGFGMAFDPLSGNLWDQENGDDAFDEMNRVTAGSNNGWVELMGPSSRVQQFKQIESTYGAGNLQQLRWPPSQIADTEADALSRLYILPGAHYNDPEFSWKYAVAPSALGFVQGRGLGFQYEGDMLVGEARTFLDGGYLFRFKLNPDRLHYSFSDARLNDLVADNEDKFDIAESESLRIGKDFGIVTDIQTGPNGHVFVVSNTNGAVYEISSAPPAVFTATLNGAQQTPPVSSTATGTASLLLSPDETTALLSLNFNGLSSTETAAHIHGPAPPGSAAGVLFPIPTGQVSDFRISLTPAQVLDLKNGQLYINVHSSNFPNGEIRGQFGSSASASTVQFSSASYFVSESAGRATITLSRSGDTSNVASVDYATSDTSGAANCDVITGNASARCDYTPGVGTIHFAPGETSQTIDIPLTDDAYAEGNEKFSVSLSNPIGTALGSPNTATVHITDNETTTGPNPIDATDFFVRRQYLDFFSREPDTSGYSFWRNQINVCGSDQACIRLRRINVSAAFFVSVEFQQTGYLVERLYRVAYGSATGNSTFGGAHTLTVPVVRFNEFLPDTQAIGKGLIVGQPGWETVLENNKQALTNDFVQRSRFTTAYPLGMTAADFVDALNVNAGGALSQTERDQLVSDLTMGTKTRAQVLRAVAEDTDLYNDEFNRAFVLMQYYGYLRRNPNDSPEASLDYTGFDFWLKKLNAFHGNYVNAQMVQAFLDAGEYRQRFGP
jgi:uncharacterized repeat protein (TIGR01451 family)